MVGKGVVGFEPTTLVATLGHMLTPTTCGNHPLEIVMVWRCALPSDRSHVTRRSVPPSQNSLLVHRETINITLPAVPTTLIQTY